jgi:hypothetical protein
MLALAHWRHYLEAARAYLASHCLLCTKAETKVRTGARALPLLTLGHGLCRPRTHSAVLAVPSCGGKGKGKTRKTGKRKWVEADKENEAPCAEQERKRVRVVGDEFVVQSLILGSLVGSLKVVIEGSSTR